jgi:DHA2 family multidrug resistance protein
MERDESARQYPATRLRIVITCSVMLATIMQVLDSTIANVALPNMEGSLSTTQDEISWVLTSYIVASAIATPLSGWLAGRFGRRRVFLFMIIGFTILSVACGLSTSLSQMVTARFFQGLCGAALVPLSQATMLDINPPHRHAQAMAVWGMGVMVGPILGPTLGGWLTDNYNWRWVFYVNVPIGVLACIGILLGMRETAPAAKRLDTFGFAFLSIAIAALQLFLDRGEIQDWFDSVEIRIEFWVAIIAFVVFIIHTLTTESTSFFNRRLALDRNFVAGCCFYFVLGALLYSTRALLPPFLQDLLGYPVSNAGYATAPSGAGSMIAMMLAGQLLKRFSAPSVIAFGFLIAAFSLWQMTGFDLYISERIIVINGFIQGLGIGMISVPLTTATFSTLNPSIRGDGTAIYSLSRNIGSSIGISVVQTLLTRNAQISHASLVQYVSVFNPLLQDANPQQGWDIHSSSGLAAINAELTKQATMIAYLDDFRMLMLMTLITIPFVFLLKRARQTRAS